jgi:hypothetical protein
VREWSDLRQVTCSPARQEALLSLVLLLPEARSAVLSLAFTSYTYQGTDFREFVSLVCVTCLCLFVCQWSTLVVLEH